MIEQRMRILVFGTFDVLHDGHRSMFLQARSLSHNPYLIVSVARDKNTEAVKGEKPHHSQQQRLESLKQCDLVNKSILGSVSDYISHIIKLKPDIIALGYDQSSSYTRDLKKNLNARGLNPKIVRLKPYKPDQYKSSLLKKKLIKSLI